LSTQKGKVDLKIRRCLKEILMYEDSDFSDGFSSDDGTPTVKPVAPKPKQKVIARFSAGGRDEIDLSSDDSGSSESSDDNIFDDYVKPPKVPETPLPVSPTLVQPTEPTKFDKKKDGRPW
jgi:hypothetical protein